MNPCEIVAFVSTAACAIAKCAPEEELPMLAAAFTQLGDTLATIITSKEFLTDAKKKAVGNGAADDEFIIHDGQINAGAVGKVALGGSTINLDDLRKGEE